MRCMPRETGGTVYRTLSAPTSPKTTTSHRVGTANVADREYNDICYCIFATLMIIMCHLLLRNNNVIYWNWFLLFRIVKSFWAGMMLIGGHMYRGFPDPIIEHIFLNIYIAVIILHYVLALQSFRGNVSSFAFIATVNSRLAHSQSVIYPQPALLEILSHSYLIYRPSNELYAIFYEVNEKYTWFLQCLADQQPSSLLPPFCNNAPSRMLRAAMVHLAETFLLDT